LNSQPARFTADVEESHPLSDNELHISENATDRIDHTAVRWVLLGMLGIVIAGFVAYSWLGTPPAPPPPDVANDSLLLEGRSVYLARCATCHGREGRGDGPIAGYLLGPPVGNINDGKWKHGDKPEQVLGVISKGVEGTRMAGWGQLLEPSELRAVTAYVYYLAKQPVPEVMRQAPPD
jgi:cytochrome c oxidase cbb3-type subunit 3